jgi:hypothetical protein
MGLSDFLSIAGAVLLALGGGTAIVYAFAKWLGGVWANRILENERASATREHELLIRRRNVYAKLAISLRVFLRPHEHNPQDNREKFLEAYDEAALWAPDEIMNAIGIFLDMNRQNTATPGSVKMEGLQAAYADCIVAMRKDCGFPQTEFKYRVVSF